MPVFCISTNNVPLATQSKTNNPPTSWTASDTSFKKSSDTIIPADVSTCGQNTMSGFFEVISDFIISIEAGAKGDKGFSET